MSEHPGKNNGGNPYGRRRSDRPYRPLGEEIINYQGRVGLFTPLTRGPSPQDEDSRQNLIKLVERLKEEINTLKQENQALRHQLSQLKHRPARPPEDFVSAIRHTVDSLQTRLSQLDNPLVDFIIKDFRLEARAFVEVDELGLLKYRFVRPEDDIDPQLLSRITLDIAPLPREGDRPQGPTRPEFTAFLDVDEIQGIGEHYKTRLRQHHIYTVEDLLQVGARSRSRVELATLLDVDLRRLGEWLAQARLMTIRGIDGRRAEILLELGIDGLERLAEADPAELGQAYNARVKEKGQQNLQPVDEKTVSGWIATARAYLGRRRSAETPSQSPTTPEPQ